MAATMKDIAKMTGLGLATISKYLNGGQVRPQNKKLIDEAVKELQFVPNEFARSLKTKHSRTIGVVIPELSNVFITSIISTMEDILRKHNYAVIVCDCRTDIAREKEAVSFLVQKRVDGLINMATDQTGAHLTSALEANIPIILVDRMLQPLAGRVSAVVVDNVDAAHKATQFLLEAGHREIGLILGDKGIYTSEKRREGYVNAFAALHLQPREELIRYSNYTTEGGYVEMKHLLSLHEPPTAVLVTNYEMTLGSMLAISERNISMPEELSFIGFDKVDVFAGLFSNLTLIKQPQNAIGECVAKQMLSLLAKEQEDPVHMVITLATQLIEGTSTSRRKETFEVE
ncbi:MAG: LacI family transcriptional regulator [Clostridiales bacterium]|nr:LacI family transcriptional regulator [Clostridiales bacterium]